MHRLEDKMETKDKLLLHRASAQGDLEHVKELISAGWDIECTDEHGATPLFAASFKGQAEVAKFLISKGADVNRGNVARYTPLMTASREKHPGVVKVLLEAKADTEAAAESGMKALHWALMDTIPVGSRHFETETTLIEVLELLREHGADINAKGVNGETPLMDAAWWGLAEATKYLLSCGARCDEKDNEGQTAVDYAKKRIAQNLGADVNQRCQQVIDVLSGRTLEKKWWRFWQ
jgi:ankyrin repeat protein